MEDISIMYPNEMYNHLGAKSREISEIMTRRAGIY